MYMPWKASSVVDERARFVVECEQGWLPISQLCRIYGISRQTGYEWLRRFRQFGVAGLQDVGRAPLRHPNQKPAEMVEAVLKSRRVHMTWGPRKLRQLLRDSAAEVAWPALSTMGVMIARAGLALPQKKRRKVPPYTQPFAAADAPNRVWCMDFKGWFRARDGTRIDPLTVTDAYSRYLLRCQTVEKTATEQVHAILEAAFREYGMPEAMRSDNGAPFASRAIAGLSRLSVYLMKLGIVPERIQPGHPEQNGRHERMHRTLKQETASPPAATARAQQRAFDRFRREYNEERPHEALDLQTPAARYETSARAYPARVPEPEYPATMEVRKVRDRGAISWRGHRHVFLSETLIGERVGLEQIDDECWKVYFAAFPIALFDSRELAMRRLPPEPSVPVEADSTSPQPGSVSPASTG
jgi:putative transposase